MLLPVTADRLTYLITIDRIVSWWIIWVNILNQADPDSGAAHAFTNPEIGALAPSNQTERAGFRGPRRSSRTSASWRLLGEQE